VSRRHEQQAAALERAVRTALARGVNDPRVKGLITVVGVDLQQDLTSATVRVSVMPESAESATIHGLQAAAAHIRHEIADEIPFQRTPTLKFKIDHSIKEEAAVLAAINRELEKSRRPGGAGEQTPDDAHTSGEHRT